MVGIILGSGIFVAPAAVAAVAPEAWQGALVWLVGGGVALCGAFCYAECAVRMPCDGGFFVYYERAFGPAWARVAGWAAWLVTYPASLCAMAWIAASYLHGMFPNVALPSQHWAALLLTGATAMVALGVRFGAWLQRVLTTSKVLAILAVVGAAVVYHFVGTREVSAPAAPLALLPFTPSLLLTAFATLMWTFDGWSDITMLTGEIQRPERNLARAAMWGVMIPAVCYALLQIAVTILLPASQAMRSPHVLSDALARFGGGWGGHFLALLAIVSAVGALHGVFSAVSRLGWAMGKSGQLPTYFSHRHRRFDTPVRALAVPWGMSLIYLYTNNFSDLIGYFAFAVWLYYASTAAALLKLRHLRVGEPVGWRAPGGVLAPAVVLLVAAVMTALQIQQGPWRTLAGLGLVGVWALFQALHQRWKCQQTGSATPGDMVAADD